MMGSACCQRRLLRGTKMTPIALFLAQKLEDTHPTDSSIQLLMYNAADELRKQHEKIKELEAKLETPNV